MRNYLTILVALFSFTTTTAAQERGFLPTDFYSEIEISEVAISPAGDLVAFTVITANKDTNDWHREIWMVSLQNGSPAGEPFRFTSPTGSSSSPRWSPDGSVLSFASSRGNDENSTWFVKTQAPFGSEYHIEGVTAAPIWSSDGQWIAFVDTPNGRVETFGPGPRSAPGYAVSRNDPGTSSRKGWISPDAITNTLDPEQFDGRVVTALYYQLDGILPFLPDPSTRGKNQLFVVNATGGQARQLTNVPFDVYEVAWSPDSSTLIFSGNPQQPAMETNEENMDLTFEIYSIARNGGDPKRLTENPGAERMSAWSHDGQHLAFLSTAEQGAETDLHIVEVAADGTFRGSRRNLTEAWDLKPGQPTWTPEGRLRFHAGIRGDTHLFEIDPSNNTGVQQITHGSRRISGTSASRDGQVMAYTVTDPASPSEVFVSAGDGTREMQVTSFNAEWLSDIALMPAEQLTWQVDDGTEIEGWVIKPVGYDSSKSYPMVLWIHGGPHAAYGNYWSRIFHVMSNSGFFVLYSNPRGSTNYGHEFTYSTTGNREAKWGEMDQEDYLKGVEATIAKYPAIDPVRVGVSGGSYGGFMTNWLTATTDRFAAAVTTRSIVNWEAWYGNSEAPRHYRNTEAGSRFLTRYAFGGAPYEQRERYHRLSPISYVENVTAPTLIIHPENDYSTPLSGAQQWFTALMELGIPTELVIYPRSAHDLASSGEPWLLTDRLERIRSWFIHWLIDMPTTTSN